MKAVTITAIVAITVLEGLALYRGIDGTYLSMVIGVIAGLAGYLLPSPLQR